jgi:hypothetical protein
MENSAVPMVHFSDVHHTGLYVNHRSDSNWTNVPKEVLTNKCWLQILFYTIMHDKVHIHAYTHIHSFCFMYHYFCTMDCIKKSYVYSQTKSIGRNP